MGNAIWLNELTRFGGETGAGAMVNRCAFTSRDMAADWPDAFVYAIVMGWESDPDHPEDGDPMAEVAERFGWDEPLVEFLRDAHSRFSKLQEHHEVTDRG